MLYGIAVIVLAAIVFLIVFNMNASRAAAPSKPPAASEPERRYEAASSAPPPQAQEPSVKPPAEASFSDAPASVPLRAETAHFPPRATARPSRTPAMYREQSDDEYRQALRSFKEMGTKAEPDSDAGGLPPRRSKDADYREGLRSLTRRDSASEPESARKERE